MPKTNEEKLRKEWNESGVDYRMNEISDYWLKVLAEQRREWVESVRREIGSMCGTISVNEKSNVTDAIDTTFTQTIEKVLSLPSLTTDSE